MPRCPPCFSRTVAAIVVLILSNSGVGAPVSRKFSYEHPTPGPTGSAWYYYELDVNGDLVKDLRFKNFPLYGTQRPLGLARNDVEGLNGTAIAFDGYISQLGGVTLPLAQGLAPGESIGPALSWTPLATISTFDPVGGDPAFQEPNTSLGVRLMLDGQPHYAWVGVNYRPYPGTIFTPSGLTLRDSGWETSAGTAIGAGVPEPGAMTLFAVAFVCGAGRRTHRKVLNTIS